MGTAGSAGLRGEGDPPFGPGRLHVQSHDAPHQSRDENLRCVISLHLENIVKVNGAPLRPPTTIKPD